MPPQPLLPVLMMRMPLSDFLQTVPHHHLIKSRRENRRRHVNQDRDPRVTVVREGLPAEEYRGDDPCAQITSEICGDGDAGEPPDHVGVGHADDEGRADGGHEGVGGIEGGPDDDPLDEAL